MCLRVLIGITVSPTTIAANRPHEIQKTFHTQEKIAPWSIVEALKVPLTSQRS